MSSPPPTTLWCRCPTARYLAERIPGSELTVLPASHFAWEEIPDQFAALITDSVTEAENRTSQ